MTRLALPVACLLAALTVGALTDVAGVLYAQGVRGVCRSEDSTGCVWIGPLQGNRRGGVVVNPSEQQGENR